jgi:opine dehydrogenase
LLHPKISVAILGAGHGGLALAGTLARQGHSVALWNRSSPRVEAVARLDGLRLGRPESSCSFVPIRLATTDLGAALARAGLVLIAVPACGHADVARACAPHLRDGQAVLLLPGRTGGALEFRRALRAAGCRARVLLGEANTFPLASRCVGPASAVVFGIKAEVMAAALPANRTPELLAAFRPLLPMLAPARSVLHTGLDNFGALLHPTITLCNARRIARRERFDFYTQGVTPAVADVLAAADRERRAVAHAYGVEACSLCEWVGRTYGHHAGTLLAAVGGNPAYAGITAPDTLEHRYLLEDVPTGLVPLGELGRAAGVATPTLDGLVEYARMALGVRRWQRPRTLEALGLDGLTPEEIGAFVKSGRVPAAPWPVAASYGSFGTVRALVPQF